MCNASSFAVCFRFTVASRFFHFPRSSIFITLAIKMSILNSESKKIFKKFFIENYDLQDYRMTACGKSDG